jgi:hypothetical protein
VCAFEGVHQGVAGKGGGEFYRAGSVQSYLRLQAYKKAGAIHKTCQETVNINITAECKSVLGSNAGRKWREVSNFPLEWVQTSGSTSA